MKDREFKRHPELADSYESNRSSLVIKKLHADLAAEIQGIDLRRPMDEGAKADLNDACVTHGVLLFRGQDLTPKDLVAISGVFGAIVPHVVDEYNDHAQMNVTVLSNVRDATGRLIGADRSGMQWHTDGSFRSEPPKITILYGVECPAVGAETEFCSTFKLFDDLQVVSKKVLRSCVGVHDYSYYWEKYQGRREPLTPETLAKVPPVSHPALRTHPVSGFVGTYVMECMTTHLIGSVGDAGRELIAEVMSLAERKDGIFAHHWRPGDLLIWDNRSTMHRATEFDDKYRRIMHRTSIVGDRPYFDRG